MNANLLLLLHIIKVDVDTRTVYDIQRAGDKWQPKFEISSKKNSVFKCLF